MEIIRSWQKRYIQMTSGFHLNFHITSATQVFCFGVTFDSSLIKFRYRLLQLLETAVNVTPEILKDIFSKHSSFQFLTIEITQRMFSQLYSLFQIILIVFNVDFSFGIAGTFTCNNQGD